ncbi:hypothetical protein CC2G_001676 [Coprinopsis cinerea AmutBmut pab1-1]|nr:hypothetical protein CC2G_001676 [Coprinopsis cinerea AmutBmut pab1-1]
MQLSIKVLISALIALTLAGHIFAHSTGSLGGVDSRTRYPARSSNTVDLASRAPARLRPRPQVVFQPKTMKWLKAERKRRGIPKDQLNKLLRWNVKKVREEAKKDPYFKGVNRIQINKIAHSGGRPGNRNADPRYHITAQFQDNRVRWDHKRGRNGKIAFPRPNPDPQYSGDTHHVYPSGKPPVNIKL